MLAIAKAINSQRKNFVNCWKDPLIASKMTLKTSSIRAYSNPKPYKERIADIVRKGKKVKVDGNYINCVQVGEGDHCVACIPGSLGSIQTDMGIILEEMDPKPFTIVGWDPPGYGKSRPPRRNFQGEFWKRDAQCLARLMKKLGHEKYSLMAWSKGGCTAIALASAYPENVRKLVTWGSPSFPDPDLAQFIRSLKDFENWAPMAYTSMEAEYGDDYLKEMLEEWIGTVDRRLEARTEYNSVEDLKRIQCPALIIHGTKDDVTKVEHAHHLIKHIKHSKLHIIEGAKHGFHFKRTDEFLKLVQAFLCE